MATNPTPQLPAILQFPASASSELITQGAEARLYKTSYLRPDLPCALKYRPPKPWRHPVLDQRLTKHRILTEARILAKCRRDGVRVPTVYAIDEAAGWLMLEWIPGNPVRVAINDWLAQASTPVDQDDTLRALLRRIGSAVGLMHKMGVVHGDLTTSNIMLSPPPQGSHCLAGEIVIIDFGLASGSIQDEDRAVDLYVLERAFGSTHPAAESVFEEVLEAYKHTFNHAPIVLKRLKDVRMRGRKRSMLG
ncbi:hypothetical protein CDD80_6355 [Ophiocordyceps camponoti-rufipedis]|uniref:EKC/KEOPS complex subunit BUD32 n=1 Tax=Ophiocordyceps camponoti-rufipedis TaxID=2004952 RepID=A0A2C5ZFZ1_9HYPO|nr:hypothetical protein CDD80_6355 [Ophiocordyceps camponoti-rufipedis]